MPSNTAPAINAEPLTVTEVPGPRAVPPAKPLVQQRMGLYDVTLESLQLEDALIESGGELTPDLEERFNFLLQQGPRAIEAGIAIMRELEASRDAAATERDRQNNRMQSFERNADNLKGRIRAAVDSPMFSGKVKTPRFTAWTQKAADRLLVEFQAQNDTLENLHAVHPQLVKVETTYKLDSAAVRAIWDAERPAREAYELIMEERQREIDLAVESGSNRMEAEKRYKAPPRPKSKLPEVVEVTEVAGTRYLRVK